jgi:2-iminobutanoate/2-iminopropanoate deaminase
MAKRPGKKAPKKAAKKATKKAAKKVVKKVVKKKATKTTSKRPAKKAAARSVASQKLSRVEIAAADIPTHPQPFPTACKVGNVVFSSAVSGEDPVTHQIPENPRQQVLNAFRTVRRIMEEAGGTLDNIGKVTVYVKDRDIRPVVNAVWEEIFNNPKSRPVRHMVPFDLPPGRLLQIEFLAVV